MRIPKIGLPPDHPKLDHFSIETALGIPPFFRWSSQVSGTRSPAWILGNSPNNRYCNIKIDNIDNTLW